jgi:hypothetical protein
MMRLRVLVAAALCVLPLLAHAEAKKMWRSATPTELEAFLPARAAVEKERIETETRTASGVIDPHGKMIAAVVLITAGYSANGKYSHYLLSQAPIRIGTNIVLPPGPYVIGWTRVADGLQVHIYEAETGVERGTTLARPGPPAISVVSIRVWPPAERSVIQIGRFLLPYAPED